VFALDPVFALPPEGLPVALGIIVCSDLLGPVREASVANPQSAWSCKAEYFMTIRWA
jgi:hypothetical protein